MSAHSQTVTSLLPNWGILKPTNANTRAKSPSRFVSALHEKKRTGHTPCGLLGGVVG
ncbi:hypothetical protein SpCBS45565_g03287 [Spizellomyces sp. 'palustris']|nr:hypothetical protein SpCBS45565_g03287 [Spizellomyces sp. 'palustris']